MTTERRKAMLFLILTLVVGILIGALVPGFFGRMRRNGWKDMKRTEQRGDHPGSRRMGFQKMIYRITQADSSQRKQIQPILDEASGKIEALESESNSRMMGIMDSMKVNLKQILTEEQNKRLEEFSNKHGRRGGRGR